MTVTGTVFAARILYTSYNSCSPDCAVTMSVGSLCAVRGAPCSVWALCGGGALCTPRPTSHMPHASYVRLGQGVLSRSSARAALSRRRWSYRLPCHNIRHPCTCTPASTTCCCCYHGCGSPAGTCAAVDIGGLLREISHLHREHGSCQQIRRAVAATATSAAARPAAVTRLVTRMVRPGRSRRLRNRRCVGDARLLAPRPARIAARATWGERLRSVRSLMRGGGTITSVTNRAAPRSVLWGGRHRRAGGGVRVREVR